MRRLRKTETLDVNMKDMEIKNSFVEMESILKKTLMKLNKGEFLNQEEVSLIKRHIQKIRKLLTRDNI